MAIGENGSQQAHVHEDEHFRHYQIGGLGRQVREQPFVQPAA